MGFYSDLSMAATPIVLFGSVLFVGALVFIIWRRCAERAREINYVLQEANRIAQPHGFKAEFFFGETGLVRSVAVKGDGRGHQPVICLKGRCLNYEQLDALSREITNKLPVSRVILELAAKE